MAARLAATVWRLLRAVSHSHTVTGRRACGTPAGHDRSGGLGGTNRWTRPGVRGQSLCPGDAAVRRPCGGYPMRDIRRTLIISLFVCPTCAFLVGCGGSSSSSSSPPNTIAPSTTNVATISVSGGPLDDYPDAAFASVTLCVPGTSNCQTIDNVLVDTGSWGLRILSSALPVGLPQQSASDGNPVSECLTFVGSYTWGPVQTADVKIAGETASSVPIQVLSDAVPAPSGCTSSGFPSADTLDTLYANGILGVGLLAQDCGNPCPASYDQYYECASSTCQPIDQALSQQVTNPVALFASDNNGAIVELLAVSSAG